MQTDKNKNNKDKSKGGGGNDKSDQDKNNAKNDKGQGKNDPANQQQQPGNVSKEDAQRMLDALDAQEKGTQDKLKYKRIKGVSQRTIKDW